MCVGYPLTDLELEVADEDEVYNMQFGRFFEEQVRWWGRGWEGEGLCVSVYGWGGGAGGGGVSLRCCQGVCAWLCTW